VPEAKGDAIWTAFLTKIPELHNFDIHYTFRKRTPGVVNDKEKKNDKKGPEDEDGDGEPEDFLEQEERNLLIIFVKAVKAAAQEAQQAWKEGRARSPSRGVPMSQENVPIVYEDLERAAAAASARAYEAKTALRAAQRHLKEEEELQRSPGGGGADSQESLLQRSGTEAAVKPVEEQRRSPREEAALEEAAKRRRLYLAAREEARREWHAVHLWKAEEASLKAETAEQNNRIQMVQQNSQKEDPPRPNGFFSGNQRNSEEAKRIEARNSYGALKEQALKKWCKVVLGQLAAEDDSGAPSFLAADFAPTAQESKSKTLAHPDMHALIEKFYVHYTLSWRKTKSEVILS